MSINISFGFSGIRKGKMKNNKKVDIWKVVVNKVYSM